MNLPWELILTIGLKIIDIFVQNKIKKDQLNRSFLQFIKKQDQDIYQSLKLSSEYDEILNQIKNEEKGLKNDDIKRKV